MELLVEVRSMLAHIVEDVVNNKEALDKDRIAAIILLIEKIDALADDNSRR